QLAFCFFFSSRRRHTRSKRDWSSDVCSSDLYILGDAGWNAAPLSKPLPNFDGVRRRLLFLQQQMKLVDIVAGCFMRIPVDGHARSEERRVGKECRSRGEQGG